MGEPVENLLKNPDFEGEFDVNPDTKLATRIEGWDIVISDRWNSEQQIIPEEIDNNQDITTMFLKSDLTNGPQAGATEF